jgi:protein-S-isoprenylcysteine O-methyltransferase Ste14
MLDRVLRLVVTTLFFGGLLFVTAGTVAWPAAWAYLALVTASLVVYSVNIVRLHPDLIRERRKPPGDAKKWDWPLVAVVGALGPLVLLALCGFDRRVGWSRPMPAWLNLAGLLLVAAGHALANCAFAANRFFSALVRIQRDRGHTVVDSGSYRFVRHPGYLGSILQMFGTGFALGSWWALDVAAVVSLVVAVRTAVEDRTLQRELDGYAEYAARVRFRLVPGIW